MQAPKTENLSKKNSIHKNKPKVTGLNPNIAKHSANYGNIMPPKTTWFEPKLRSGLVIHTLD